MAYYLHLPISSELLRKNETKITDKSDLTRKLKQEEMQKTPQNLVIILVICKLCKQPMHEP